MNIQLRIEGMVPLLRELTEQYALQACFEARLLGKARGGREILGQVPDRAETEDVHADIDRICHVRFWETCQRFEARGLRVQLISEHPEDDPVVDDPNVMCYLDPFDGTDQFVHGIWEAWYSVFSFETPEGQVLFGGCIDFIAGILYTADVLQERVAEQLFEQYAEIVEGHPVIKTRLSPATQVLPSEATELNGESVVASYKGRWRYLAPWFLMVEDYLEREEFEGIAHYSWGGSFVYALLASGVLSVYLMIREPTDEIRPGRAFVAAAGLRVFSVTEGGVLRKFRWTQRRRVPFFIAAPTRDLARSIVDGIWGRDKEAIRAQKGWLAKSMRRVSRPQIQGINGQ